MNMEDFIAGYPGSEHGLRATMAQVLGEGKAQFFFEHLLDYIFAEDDVAFITLAGYTATLMQPAYARRFAGLSETELDRLLQSFAIANCRPHHQLNKILAARMALPAAQKASVAG